MYIIFPPHNHGHVVQYQNFPKLIDIPFDIMPFIHRFADFIRVFHFRGSGIPNALKTRRGSVDVAHALCTLQTIHDIRNWGKNVRCDGGLEDSN